MGGGPTEPIDEGHRLLEACKDHVIRTMRTVPDCQPGGPGAGSYEIERAAGFELALQRQDNWFTWSLLQRMARDGLIEAILTRRTRYRLLDHQSMAPRSKGSRQGPVLGEDPEPMERGALG